MESDWTNQSHLELIRFLHCRFGWVSAANYPHTGHAAPLNIACQTFLRATHEMYEVSASNPFLARDAQSTPAELRGVEEAATTDMWSCTGF